MKIHSFFRAHVSGSPATRYTAEMTIGKEYAAESTIGSFYYFLFCPTRMICLLSLIIHSAVSKFLSANTIRALVEGVF